MIKWRIIQIIISCITWYECHLKSHVLLLVSSSSQVVEEEFRQSLPWPLSNSKKVPCCYGVLQNQDDWLSFLLFFWKGHSSSTVLPCLGALEQTQLWSRVGEKVSWVLNLACLVPLCMGWHLISKDDSYWFWFHFLHWWTLEVESSQHAGLSWTFGLDLWRSAFRRRT